MTPSSRSRLPLALALLVAASIPTGAHEGHLEIPLGPNSLVCGGAAIEPDVVVSGSFPESLSRSYVMLPFEVPPGTTQVRVKYCYEGGGNTVDLGVWQARDGAAPWGDAQFRGWGGSSHPDVALTVQGFSSEEDYLADPKLHRPGRTTRGFLPGELPPGTWAAELGVAYVVPEAGGTGAADFRVEIELSDDPAFDDEPYVPTPYDETPASTEPGWYVGDLHVHAEHSALGDATMREVFDAAFDPPGAGGADLDFIALSDYVTTSAWPEIGRYQADYPGKLVIRSAEIITYQGHANQHRALEYVDHRAGPVHELDTATGELTLLRAERPPAEMFAQIEAAGGLAQINHAASCPSSVPYCAAACRGCSWDYTPAQSGYDKVGAIEGPSGVLIAWGAFGPQAVQFWQDRLDEGHRIAVVGVSDSHRAGGGDSPIGGRVTVVYAEQLSEQGVLDAIRAGHTYAKIYASEPDLRFTAEGDGGGSGMMGDAIPDPSATLHAEVLGVPASPPYRLRLVHDGATADEVDVVAPGGPFEFRAETPGNYRLELVQTEPVVTVTALTSSIQVPEPAAGAAALAASAALAALRRRRRR